MRWLLPVLVSSVLGSAAFAQTAATSSASKPAIPQGFEPISGKEARAESVSANAMVVGAYAAVLGLVFGFVIHVVRSQGELAREMKELADKIEKSKRT